MPTPAEQKALIFLGAVALVGGAVRLLGGGEPVPPPTAAEQEALASQIVATESASAAKRAGRAGKEPRSRRSRRRGSSAPDSRPPSPDAPSTADGRPPAADGRYAPLDVDRATADQLDALPGVGPSLAARIVADREAHGAFGSMEALDAVSGVGPTLIKRLRGHVTFSGPPRPSTANGSGGGKRLSGRVVGLIGGRP